MVKSAENRMRYIVRMLFPSIETGTDMNARESENYLPISRSFMHQNRFFWAKIYRGRLLTFITGSSSKYHASVEALTTGLMIHSYW
jgi:hypothetical protein